MITFASRVKLWKRATGGCFVGCLESEEGNLDRMKFEEKFFLPPGPLGRIDWDTLRVLLSFVDYRRIHREFVSHRRHQNFPFSSSHSQISHVWSMIYLLLNLFLNLELHRRSRYWTQPIYLCWGTNEKNYQKKAEHCPLMWSNTSEERSGEVDFFYNNETLKIDGRLPFVTEPIVTSYNVPSQGSEKCTMGDEMKGSW